VSLIKVIFRSKGDLAKRPPLNRIDYGRHLQSVKEVNQCEHIEKVIFNNCRKIEDFEQIEKSPGRIVLHTRFSG